jgi:hypothetical protein
MPAVITHTTDRIPWGVLAARVALPLLDRLRRSPFGGAWLTGAAFGIEAGERLFASTTRVMPYADEPVDAWLLTPPADLDRMLAGAAPEAQVGFRLGERPDVAPRVRQARAVLALAALGWCGPWPDPAANPELVALTRRACFDLTIGPADRVGALFAPGAPPELARLQLRFTDGARPRHATLGLSDTPGAPEFWTDGDVRLLRVAALHWLEVGALPGTLETERGVIRFTAAPLPLPHAASQLVRVG